ncbi:tripartite tricarboxylate transporter permease [Chelativorans sp. AA-79]|uniref:tripartite tricarboxylate transporter permease n=1 Tax=Chelativorans sp. AA-79 TaxID=3028735 RepID=UPI0023F76252|nr:tripartite tricarboxylate transporter permease [Chelativorans sp. AA-79]WEX07984.1 tripartite tricarboxylate transporter permease [Chelativorans sp. AA-79]
MEFIDNLALGFSHSLALHNILYCFTGALLGTAIGVLPGLGPLATIAMLLPLTFTLDPISALIMLAGIYYGAQYGGSTTAILVNLPGENSSVVTAIDGYQMARQGRGGAALATAALASVLAGTLATIFIASFSPLLARAALSFKSPEYFSLMIVGLIAAVILANGSIIKALGMVVIGLILGTVGTDLNSGVTRFGFGRLEMMSGLEFVAISMGLFAFAEIMVNVAQKTSGKTDLHSVSRLWPSKEDFRLGTPAAIRGTLLGAILGILPGGGAALASFSAYSLEKKVARDPSAFGQGAIQGVAAPEAANNAAAQTSFIPMLTLAIPSNGVMALMMGAMMVHNIVPGPMILTQNAPMFWALVTSMLIGNVILVLLNLPLVGLWVKLISVPYTVLYPAILMFCLIGLYGIENSSFNVYVAAVFGLVGFLLSRLRCEPAPLLLGFILGPLLEENLRRSLLLSKGDFSIFISRPISLLLLLLAAVLLLSTILPNLRKKREEAFAGD